MGAQISLTRARYTQFAAGNFAGVPVSLFYLYLRPNQDSVGRGPPARIWASLRLSPAPRAAPCASPPTLSSLAQWFSGLQELGRDFLESRELRQAHPGSAGSPRLHTRSELAHVLSRAPGPAVRGARMDPTSFYAPRGVHSNRWTLRQRRSRRQPRRETSTASPCRAGAPPSWAGRGRGRTGRSVGPWPGSCGLS